MESVLIFGTQLKDLHMDINKILKIIFIFSATIFLITILSVPKTNCEACAFEYEGRIIDGKEAFEIFEKGCISYKKPWSWEPDINITYIQ